MRDSGSRILDALPPSERDDVGRHLEVVDVAGGDLVHAAGAVVTAAHFPVSGLYTVGVPVPGGAALEGSAVGAEGVIGLSDALGGARSTREAVCQVPGRVLRLPAAPLRELLAGRGRFADLLLAHNQAEATHLSQMVVCRHHHSAEQRCATWLLQAADRLGDRDLPLTQAHLAQALGLRRATVSATAARLQDVGVIAYRYGRVTVTDRPGLQGTACPCYGVVRDAYAQLG